MRMGANRDIRPVRIAKRVSYALKAYGDRHTRHVFGGSDVVGGAAL